MNDFKKNNFKIIVSGYAGNLGTKVLIEKKEKELLSHFSKDFLVKILNDISDGQNASPFLSTDIYDKIEMGKGGFLTALWQICERNKVGIEYNLNEVPILQGTIEIANFFDINPYRLLSENVYIYLVNENFDNKIKINNTYIDISLCRYVRNIGITNDKKKRVRVDSESESFLTKDYKDEIDKVINKFSKNFIMKD